MPLQDFPVEIFQEILYHAFAVRGMKRFMRLRLVSKAFAREIENVIFAFRLLDHRLASPTPGILQVLPPLAARYLKYRVMNQAETDGYPNLVTIRKVAESISQTADVNGKQLDLDQALERLCRLVLRDASSIEGLARIFSKDPESDPSAFSHHLIVAAVDIQCFRIIREILADGGWPCYFSWLFGSPHYIAASKGDEDMLRYMLSKTAIPDQRLPKVRDQAFIAAATAGRIETVKFLYQFRREEVPWRFEDRRKGVSGTYDYPLSTAMTTPSKSILEFIASLQKKSIKMSKWRTAEASLSDRLHRCTDQGWTEMVAHLLVQGACPDGLLADIESNFRPMIHACKFGYTDIVRLLLYYSANTDNALRTAASHGHREIVELLLGARADTKGALASAASSGHRDIVRLLLDHGADMDGTREQPHPLISAFEREHTAMLDLLIQRGATVTDSIFESCVDRAKADGLDSISSICRNYRDGSIPKEVQEYLDSRT